MQQSLTKKDLEAIQQVVDVSVQAHVDRAKEDLRPEIQAVDNRLGSVDEKFDAIDRRFEVLNGKIDGVEARLTESIRDLKQYVDATQANLRREIRKDLSEAHEELVEAIQEVIVKKEIVALKAELQKIDARLTVLEAS